MFGPMPEKPRRAYEHPCVKAKIICKPEKPCKDTSRWLMPRNRHSRAQHRNPEHHRPKLSFEEVSDDRRRLLRRRNSRQHPLCDLVTHGSPIRQLADHSPLKTLLAFAVTACAS